MKSLRAFGICIALTLICAPARGTGFRTASVSPNTPELGSQYAVLSASGEDVTYYAVNTAFHGRILWVDFWWDFRPALPIAQLAYLPTNTPAAVYDERALRSEFDSRGNWAVWDTLRRTCAGGTCTIGSLAVHHGVPSVTVFESIRTNEGAVPHRVLEGAAASAQSATSSCPVTSVEVPAAALATPINWGAVVPSVELHWPFDMRVVSLWRCDILASVGVCPGDVQSASSLVDYEACECEPHGGFVGRRHCISELPSDEELRASTGLRRVFPDASANE